MRALLLAWLAVMIIGCQGAPRLGTPEAPLVLGYVPSDLESAALGLEQGLAQLLERRSGLSLQLRPFPNARELVEAIGAGEVHLAWLDPLSYLWGHEEYGIEVSLVGTWGGSSTRQGQIIAHVDYGMVSLADLKGANFCWLDPPTLPAVVVPRLLLMANGLDPDRDLGEVIRVNSERELVEAIYAGRCQAGATAVDARGQLLSEHPDALEKLRVIAQTAPIPYPVLGFSAEVPAPLRRALSAALRDVAGERRVREALGVEGLQAAQDQIFHELRAQVAAAGAEMEALVGGSLPQFDSAPA